MPLPSVGVVVTLTLIYCMLVVSKVQVELQVVPILVLPRCYPSAASRPKSDLNLKLEIAWEFSKKDASWVVQNLLARVGLSELDRSNVRQVPSRPDALGIHNDSMRLEVDWKSFPTCAVHQLTCLSFPSFQCLLPCEDRFFCWICGT